MNRGRRLAGVAFAAVLIATVVWGAVRTYQVTGPLVEATATKIVVMKGNERWEIARDSGTTVSGELKPGATVTVVFRMSATAVTVKEAASQPAAEKAPAKSAEEPAAQPQTNAPSAAKE